MMTSFYSIFCITYVTKWSKKQLSASLSQGNQNNVICCLHVVSPANQKTFLNLSPLCHWVSLVSFVTVVSGAGRFFRSQSTND